MQHDARATYTARLCNIPSNLVWNLDGIINLPKLVFEIPKRYNSIGAYSSVHHCSCLENGKKILIQFKSILFIHIRDTVMMWNVWNAKTTLLN